MAKKAKRNQKTFVDTVLNNAQEVNDFTLKTTEEVLDRAFASGEKWQAVSHKALKGGLDLTAKNNELVFDLLDNAKEQLQENTQRIKGLFSRN